MNGIVSGGWTFVWAAYIITAIVLFGYAARTFHNAPLIRPLGTFSPRRGEKELDRDPSPREAGRGWRPSASLRTGSAPGEGR